MKKIIKSAAIVFTLSLTPFAIAEEAAQEKKIILDLDFNSDTPTQVTDKSSSQLKGTPIKIEYIENEGNGKSVFFSGSDSAIVFNSPLFNFNEKQSFTIAFEFFAKPDDNKDGCFLLTKRLSPKESGFSFSIGKAGNFIVSLVDEAKNITLICNKNSKDGAWHKVVLVVNRTSNQAVLYFDNQKVSSEPLGDLKSLANTKRDLRIGDRDYDNDFKGEIDNVKIYNYGLEEVEIIK
jgi:hypothetical protein